MSEQLHSRDFSKHLNAILVSVDYADYLALTLAYNRHHFQRVVIVTAPFDYATEHVAAEHDTECHSTMAFYANGALFNKWKALEEGLDVLGRDGWLCIMDADVCWPKSLPDFTAQAGCLYTPFRRMAPAMPEIPPEADWTRLFQRHRIIRDFSGYTQIFHASDPVLGAPPWHQTDWRHAGGADTFFQAKWPTPQKVRPPFEVLHLGEPGTNWCGRASLYLDGTPPPQADARKESLMAFMRERRQHPDPQYRAERLEDG